MELGAARVRGKGDLTGDLESELQWVWRMENRAWVIGERQTSEVRDPQRSVPSALQDAQLLVICSLPLSCPQIAAIRTSLSLAHGGHPQASSKTQQPGTDAVLPSSPVCWPTAADHIPVVCQSDSDMRTSLFSFLVKGHRANM